MAQEIPKEALHELLRTADNFLQMSPWKWMVDEDIFGVINPVTGEKAFCSILGNLGDFLGIAVYVGDEGFRSLIRLVQDTADAHERPQDAVYDQSCIVCSFEPLSEADPDDVQGVAEAGLLKRQSALIPVFRSYRPGYMPWRLSASEAALIRVAMEQAMVVAAAAQEDPEVIGTAEARKGGQYVFRVPTSNGSSGWKYETLAAPSTVNLSPPTLTLPLGVSSRLAAFKRKDRIWLFEWFFLEAPSTDDDEDRPFFPKAAMLLDVEDHTIIGMDAGKPSDGTQPVLDMIVDSFQHAGYVPRQMVVANRDNYVLLKGFCKALGVDLYLDAEMDIVADMRALYADMMEGEGEDED